MKMFTKLKRVLACLLAVAMFTAVLTACGGGGSGSGSGGSSTSSGSSSSSSNFSSSSSSSSSNSSSSSSSSSGSSSSTTSSDEIPIDEAHFPDSTFRSYVSTNFDKDNSGGLSKSEIAAATKIDVDQKVITSLNGIEYFTAPKTLICGGNDLTSLDVSNNPVLEDLSCDTNNLTSIDVSKNPALKRLTCHVNNLTTLDVSKNLALENLYCSKNQLTSLDVSNNSALKYLYCDSGVKVTGAGSNVFISCE